MDFAKGKQIKTPVGNIVVVSLGSGNVSIAHSGYTRIPHVLEALAAEKIAFAYRM